MPTYLTEAAFTIQVGWVRTGFIFLCGLFAIMGKSIFSASRRHVVAANNRSQPSF
jgi:hypothetical protein